MAEIKKLYNISLTGEKELATKMEAVNRSFDAAKKTFLELKSTLANANFSSEELKNLEGLLKLARLETIKLNQERIRLTNDGRALSNALKQERADRIANNQTISQSTDEYKKASKQLNILRSEAKALGKEFGTDSEVFIQASKKVNVLDKELKAIDAALGQFQRNVGNYPKEINIGNISTGAVDSLKNSGLGNLLSNQIDQTKGKVVQLNSEFAEMKSKLDAAKAAGVSDLNALESEIIQNRIEADKLNTEIKSSQTHLAGMGGVGNGVFQDLKSNISQLVLGYVGFQAAMSAVSSTVTRSIEFDSVNTAIASVSKETGDFAVNQKFLEDTTERLGLKLLDTSNSFKLFFAASTQSGISAESTREIFESASEAASTMKLSQEDANGVMLAFGQIASKGKVQAEELRGQIGERIPGAFGIAAKAMGVTTAELDKMMKDGKLMANDFLPKFAKQLKETYGAGQEPVKGLRAELNRLDNFISKVANNKSFTNFISFSISLLFGFVSVITSIPFGWWIGMVGFLTVAYWSNIVAIGASTAATLAKMGAQVKQMVIQGLSNALIVASTIINYAAATAIYAVAYSYQFLNFVLNILTTVFPVLRTAMLALNSTILATPIGWLVAGIIAVTAVSKAFGNEVDNTSKKIRAQGEALKLTAAQMRVNAEIEKKANEATSERIAKIQVLTQIASDLNNSDASRKKALEELIAIDGKYKTALDGNIIKTGKLNEITKELTASILEQAKAEAARALLVEKQKQIIDNEFKKATLSKTIDEKYNKNEKVKFAKNALIDTFRNLGADINIGSGAETYQLNSVEDETKKLKEDVDYLVGLVAKDKTKDKKPDGTPPLVPPLVPDPTIKDYLRDINALREANLSELKKQRLEGLITEEDFLKKSLAVNIKYNDQILAHFKGTDAATRKLRADTASDTIDKRIETNEKLFKIQEDEIKQTLENQKSIAQAKLDNVNNDPGATSLDKAEAEKVFYEEILKAQVDYNTQMSALENNLKTESKKNAEDRTNSLIKVQTDLNAKIAQLSKVKFDSLITGVEEFKTYSKNNAEIEASKQRMIILNDKNLSQKEKEREIEKINSALALANVNAELGAVNAVIKFYEDRKALQKLTNDELQKYNDLLKQKQLLEEGKVVAENDVANKGASELPLPTSDGLQKKLTSKLSKSFGLNEGESALLGESIAQSFDLASQAMSSYFEGEKQAVEQSKQLAYQRIDLEKKQLLAKAQSSAERESIEKQAQIKKDKADKEAHEKLKKIKKQELTIAFAMQLANIAVAAAANPLNAVTFGGAGLAMYGILAAIATAGYLMNMANVNKQQFARGGAIPTKGGQFVGNSHANGGIPVGMNEFEGEELAIINKNSAQSNKVFTVTGTPKQIASGINEIGGGVSFASGAIFKKYATGGYFGSSVQPPVFRSYYENRSVNNANNQQSTLDLSEVKELLIQTNQTLSREVHRKTIVSSRDMSSFQKNDDKQSQIGTL